MKLDLNKPVQTRDGRKARIICIDVKYDKQPIIALVTDITGEFSYSYDKDGYYNYERQEIKHDLVNIPEEKELWVNVYKGSSAIGHPSKENADTECVKSTRIARIKVPYKEGQFDE